MPVPDDQSAKRIAQSVIYTERQMRNARTRRARYQQSNAGRYTVAIELAASLTAFSGDVVLAYERPWDATADSGNGDYVTDCTKEIDVADRRNVGYEGVAGAQGAVEVRHGTNGRIGVICDLCCLGDETDDCVGSGS